MVKTGKSHSVSSLVFDTLGTEDFDVVASVGAGVANTVVQARLPLPMRCKIRRVCAVASAVGTGGAHSINLTVGTGTPGASGPQDGVAPANASVFTPGSGPVIAAADTPVVATPTEPDAIYPAGTLLTLRAITPAGTGSLTNLKVMLAVVPIDGNPGDNGVNLY